MADSDIKMTVWVVRGSFIVRRDALDPDDPDFPYNYLKAQGVRPEDYGYTMPEGEKTVLCPHCGQTFKV